MRFFRKLFGDRSQTPSQPASQDMGALRRRAIEELYRQHPDVVKTMVRQSMGALESLEAWFHQGATPAEEHLKTLVKMGLLSRRGLTADGRYFLREGVPKGYVPRLNVHVFDSKGMHPELINQGSLRQRPSEAQLDAFENTVSSELGKVFPG